MCVLINFILGGEFVSTTEKKTTFTLKKPGACHHARFMGKALYLLKIYILSLIYNRLTSRQLISLERMVLFILALYGKYFLQSSLTVAAPKLDMVFINNLNMFKNIDIGIANCVLQSVKRHLWYLTPELIPLSLFDKDVSIEAKQQIARKLTQISVPENFQSGKPSFAKIIDMINNDNLSCLAELVDENSWFILEKGKEFLNAVGLSSTLG